MEAWLMPVMLVGLFGLMLVVTIIPQKKRKKAAQQMMSTLGVGSQVRTIGGFVGVVIAIDDATNILQLNIGTDEVPVLVTLDKAAIYTVITGVNAEVPVVTEAGAVIEEENIMSVDDAEEAARIADKKASKATKKASKTKDIANADVTDVFAEEVTDVVAEEVTESTEEVSS